MSLASSNVKAAYAQVHGKKAGLDPAAARRNSRLKILEAHRTIPRDARAPTVVQKADADLAQQEQEMGDGDAQINTGEPVQAGAEADRNEADGPSPADADAGLGSSAATAGSPSDDGGTDAADAGPGAEDGAGDAAAGSSDAAADDGAQADKSGLGADVVPGPEAELRLIVSEHIAPMIFGETPARKWPGLRSVVTARKQKPVGLNPMGGPGHPPREHSAGT